MRAEVNPDTADIGITHNGMDDDKETMPDCKIDGAADKVRDERAANDPLARILEGWTLRDRALLSTVDECTAGVNESSDVINTIEGTLEADDLISRLNGPTTETAAELP